MRTKHILLVDDDAENREELSMALEFNNFKVTCVSSGEESIETARNEKFDLVLMDIKMPGLGGIEASKIIKESLPLLPVMAVTAALQSEMKQVVDKELFENVFFRPFEIDEFVDELNGFFSNGI